MWIDPLDATKEYTENLLEFVTTMVCVAHKGIKAALQFAQPFVDVMARFFIGCHKFSANSQGRNDYLILFVSFDTLGEPIIGVIHLPFKNQTVWAWKGHGRSPIPEFQTVQRQTNFDEMKIIVSRSHPGKVTDLAIKAFGEKSEIIPAGGAGFKALHVAQRKVDAYIHMTAIKKWDICAGHALLSTMQGDMTDLNGNKIDYSASPHEENREPDVKLFGGLVATYQNHLMIVKRVKKAKEQDSIVVT